MERKRESEGHSLPGERKGRDKSRHRKKARGVRGTHGLERAEEEASQDTERRQASKDHSRTVERTGRRQVRTRKRRNRVSERHPQTGGRIGRDMSGQESEQAKGTHFLQSAGGGSSQNREIKLAEPVALTSYRARREGQVRAWKERERARGTHELESAEGGLSQAKDRKKPSEWQLQTGEQSRGDKLERRKKPSQREALTVWRSQKEGQSGGRKRGE
jgi:hypothetical protein